MSLYVLTPLARSDIFAIWCYIDPIQIVAVLHGTRRNQRILKQRR